jgi:hypothetical protein
VSHPALFGNDADVGALSVIARLRGEQKDDTMKMHSVILAGAALLLSASIASAQQQYRSPAPYYNAASDYYNAGGRGSADYAYVPTNRYGGAARDAYASGNYVIGGDDTWNGGYILHGVDMSESEAVAYCARNFRSYDIASQTFAAYSGERVNCPQ